MRRFNDTDEQDLNIDWNKDWTSCIKHLVVVRRLGVKFFMTTFSIRIEPLSTNDLWFCLSLVLVKRPLEKTTGLFIWIPSFLNWLAKRNKKKIEKNSGNKIHSLKKKNVKWKNYHKFRTLVSRTSIKKYKGTKTIRIIR